MSTVSRVVSGSLASWATIGINLLSQLFIVPVYLTYWDVKLYGIWIAIQGLFSILTIIEKSHIGFLGYEFLRIVNNSRNDLGVSILSGVCYGVIIGALQLAATLLIVYSGFLSYCLGFTILNDKVVMQQAGTLLILLMISSFIYVSVGGILIRALSALDYYPRMAWWGVFYSFYNLLIPAIVVSQGGSLITIGIAILIFTIGFALFAFVDMINLLKKEKISFKSISWLIGFKNVKKSFAIAGRDFLDSFRQQSLRVILAPLTGSASLVAFFTMRTGANVALQGLNTVVYPLVPELSKFLHQRDQARIEAAFGTIWLVVIGLLAPGVVMLQALIEPFFVTWTRHQINFDPLLFSFLSISVLIYAISQPATAIVITNNLLKTQVIIATMIAIVILTGIWLLVPKIGIIGAAISLLLGEISSAIYYRIAAKKWLTTHSLSWPNKALLSVLFSALFAAISMLIIIQVPLMKWFVVFAFILLSVVNFYYYWKLLPDFITARANKVSRLLTI
ncbi:lipopolysaccharide biosynthesis protein [Spirosoma foliorum]|uniref:Polysaccharide biosynthesis C-terminal domain-containing protein n=2 Tax=Spirosoma foliorum TaxID=2710596 RepID=A0A7G5GYN1_9BACT|nr:polysaccharide biosynthesis C-terminal domain-containing protein [Spirosoma foliorum]QMW03973.1 polysaccharide biosynthesis C-terminal domain-containing protein [Spirosoma foliorum]